MTTIVEQKTSWPISYSLGWIGDINLQLRDNKNRKTVIGTS